MSGHSKWATTKRKKAAIDAKRGKIFTKLAKLITIAARDGKSGDPGSNPSLRMAIENAKGASMPKENIDRAIKRGIGGLEGAVQIEEVTYEAYGPFGVGLIIECLTDNRNRTIGEIKAILNKMNGSVAGPGSVSYQFKKVGQIIIDEEKNSLIGEDLEMTIIDSGAEDFEKDDNLYVVYTTFSGLASVQKKLEQNELVIDSAEFSQITDNLIDLTQEQKTTVYALLEKLEDLDDVSSVYTNANL